jgi:hypothetical protein
VAMVNAGSLSLGEQEEADMESVGGCNLHKIH